MKLIGYLAVLLLPVWLLAGCGGSGSRSSSGPGSLSVRVYWPPSRLIPSGTKSIKVTLTQGATEVRPAQLITQSLSNPTQTVTFTALDPGTYTLNAAAYASTDGTGTPLVSGSASGNVVAGQTTNVTITFPALPTGGLYAYLLSYNPDATYEESAIAVFTVQTDGSLQSVNQSTLAAGFTPRSMAVAAAKHGIYVGDDASNQLFQYKINADGTVSPLSPTSLTIGNGPNYVKVDPSGQYIYALSQTDNVIYQFKINPDSTLSPLSPATVATGRRPTAFDFYPGAHLSVAVARAVVAGDYVYVLNSQDLSISQYRENADGTLTPLSPPTVGESGSDGLVVDRNGGHVYVGSIQGSSLYVFQYNITPGGTLAGMTPQPVLLGNAPGVGVKMTAAPNGKAIYAVNPGSSVTSPNTPGVVYQMAINADGTLSPLNPVTVAPNLILPDQVFFEPQGRFAYIYDELSNVLNWYRLNADGTLTSVGGSGYRTVNEMTSMGFAQK